MEAGFSTVEPSEEPGFPSQWSVRMGLVTGLVWSTATLPWIALAKRGFQTELLFSFNIKKCR